MGKTPAGTGDPMEREVERLLAQLGGKRTPPTAATSVPRVKEVMSAASPATIVWATTPASTAVPTPAPAIRPEEYETAALWGRVLLGSSLAFMMGDWPYANSCGWPLLGYAIAVATLLVTGGWIALTAWKQRNGRVLILAFILFYWGLILAAEMLLPRIGYASMSQYWGCRQG